jgi:hypothetical protein
MSRLFTLNKFCSAVISHFAVDLCYTYNDLCNDTNILYYDEMWDFFYEYYYERMSNRYFEIKYDNVNESVITEETTNLKVKRRLDLIDNEISRLMDRYYKGEKICDLYETAKMFVRVVTESVVEYLYYNTFYMIDETSDEWESIVNSIYDYIKDNYGEMLTNRYDKTCKNMTCSKCGWSWKLSDGGEDPYTCHKCGHIQNQDGFKIIKL